jgi:TetR/AcrR family transcriptional regulator, lmrAB and yxaGH operons repressor
MANDSRARMVVSAASLISRHGMSATSFSDVLADSGAPRGSIYHHFPDGKAQLVGDAVRWTAERVLAYQRNCPASTPTETLDWFIDLWRRVVVASHATAGCAIAGVAVDTAPDDVALMAAVRESFAAWVDLLADQLRSAGVESDQAAPIAVATLAGMEGALVLCRATGDSAPLETVARQLLRLLPA